MMLRCSPVGVNGLAGQYPVDPIARQRASRSTRFNGLWKCRSSGRAQASCFRSLLRSRTRVSRSSISCCSRSAQAVRSSSFFSRGKPQAGHSSTSLLSATAQAVFSSSSSSTRTAQAVRVATSSSAFFNLSQAISTSRCGLCGQECQSYASGREPSGKAAATGRSAGSRRQNCGVRGALKIMGGTTGWLLITASI